MKTVHLRRLLAVEWDIVSGILAAVTAMILSYFSVVDATMVRAILLLLCALILVREFRNDYRLDINRELLDVIHHELRDIRETIGETDVVVIGALAMRHEVRDFASHVRGDVTWYNVCPRMFRREDVFTATLAQLIANPEVTSIHVFCNPCERDAWESIVAPRLRAMDREGKVGSPTFQPLSPAVSFVMGEREGMKHPHALVAILAEPFARQGTAPIMPRYLFRVQNHRDIISDMAELARASAHASHQQDEAQG